MPGIFHKLKAYTATIMSPEIHYAAVFNAVESLKHLFYEATAFNEGESSNRTDIKTGTGIAISPVSASLCINDMMRTRVFLMGLQDAINDKLEQNNGGPVKILYAGTGPFATLFTPLTTIFSPQQLQVLMLEINPQAVAYLRKTIHQFDLSAYISDVVIADAANYVLPGDYQPDILLIETMQAALKKEPQLSITTNLIAQCNRNIILIPQCITVEAALMGADQNGNPIVCTLKKLLDLNEGTARQIQKSNDRSPFKSEAVSLSINKIENSACQHLSLATTIQVYKDHQLGHQACGLTIPVRLTDLAGINSWPQTFSFKYEIDPVPGFVFVANVKP